MIFGNNSKYMLKFQKAKAKLIEFSVLPEDYPRFNLNSNELSFPSTYILSRYAECIIENNLDEINELSSELLFAAQYYDAALNSKDRTQYDLDFILSGAATYFFADDYGSAKVLSKKANDYLKRLDNRNPQKLLVCLFQLLFENDRSQYTKEIDLFAKINNRIIDYFVKGLKISELLRILNDYRLEVYDAQIPDEVFYVDILIAIIIISIKDSSWILLPRYSGLLPDAWYSYLSKKNSVRILWAAQKLIGEQGVLAGKNAVVQLPTGVGKTKSIELIIRSAFLSKRATTAIVVAPLRALCNEITYDLNRSFYNEAIINQISDVLQDDYESKIAVNDKKIIICTPEKLSYIIHHQNDYLDSIDLFVFDEGHMFDDRTRGAAYELLITYVKQHLSYNQQCVLLSAVLPNAQQIKEWIFADNGVLATDSNIRTTPKSIGFTSANRDVVFFADSTDQEDYYIPRVLKPVQIKRKKHEGKKVFPDLREKYDVAIYYALKLSLNGGIAIYLNQQRLFKSAFIRIIDLMEREVDFSNLSIHSNVEEIKRLSSFIGKYYGDEHYYTKVSRIGIMPHSAILQNGIKIAVEFAMKKNMVSCVVCTSTLAQGVNIPIRYLLVNSLRVGQDIIKVREFQNLIGRTARSGIYTEGSIIITDNKLYDNRKIKKNGGYYRWEECKKLIDANSMEPCSSSILSLVQNTKIDYESKFPSKNFIEFVLNDFDNENVFQEYIKYIFDKYIKKYPSKNTDYYYSIIYNEVFFRKSVISQIENYLCTIYSKATSFFEASVALNICRSTLAYTLANDEEKALLERVFIRIEEKILKLSTNKIANYALSMIGIDMSEKIESWINDNQLTDKLFSESELMDLVKCFFIETHTIRKCKDDFLTICDLWVDGKTPFEMHNIADNDMNDIDDVCSKQISYELSFFIGNIRDLLADSTGLFKDELEEELSLMQKKVKYGVPTLTALSICEKVFYDRLLAVKISDVLEDDDISEDEIIISIQQRKEEIMELLNDYPEFFGARINSAIQ